MAEEGEVFLFFLPFYVLQPTITVQGGEEGRPKVFATYCHVIDQRGERQFRLFSCVSFMGLGLPYLLYITLLHFSLFVRVCVLLLSSTGGFVPFYLELEGIGS